MLFRIFISLIVLACAYLVFESARHVFLQRSLMNEKAEYTLGNPDGDLTLVEFFEYNCPECRAIQPILQQAIEKDGGVLFVPRPITFQDPQGIDPALLPYAAAKQGKFTEMHQVLIDNYRVINEQVLQDLSLLAGVDAAQLKEDLKHKDVIKAVQKNSDLYRGYRLQGTPAFAVGKGILFVPAQDLSVNQYLVLFDEARRY